MKRIRSGFLAVAVGALSACESTSALAVGSDITGSVSHVGLMGNQAARVLPPADVAYLDAADQASVHVLGGEVSYLTLSDSATANVDGGTISYLQLHGNSTANVNGGDISWLIAEASSRAHVRGVDELSWLILRGGGVAHVYGRDFQYSSGHLFGKWASGASFQFWALQHDNPSIPPVIGPMPAGLRLHVIPEPAAASLSLFAALGLAAVHAAGRRRVWSGDYELSSRA